MTSTLFLVVGATLLVSAICSLLEATLYSTRLAALEAARATPKHVAAAQRMLALKKDVSRPTSAILILNTVANTAGATVAGMLAAAVWGPGAVPIFSAVLTAAILFASEILPKTFGALYWRTIWPSLTLPLHYLVTVMRPLIWVTDRFSSLILTKGKKHPVTTEAEIVAMIHMGANAGQLTTTETELLTSVFHFDDLVCGDVMVPWTEVVRLEVDWTLSRCEDVVREAAHSRYPVCDSSGAVLGAAVVSDLFIAKPDATLESLVRPVMTVPQSLAVPLVLRKLQAERRPMAIVVDEYGNTTGMLTVVDVLEEIVGALADEQTTGEPELHERAPGEFAVSGVLPIARLQRDLGIELPDQPNARTLSGWLAASLGRLPKIGDEVKVPGGTVRVERVVNHRADRLQVVVEEPGGDQEGPE